MKVMMSRFRFPAIFIIGLFFQFNHAKGAVKLDSATLKNSKTGESFTNELVTRLLGDLSKIAQGHREPWVTYYTPDIAAVDAITSLQSALFDLSAYFATNTQGFVTNKYLPGVALEHSTTRCDSIASNRFPRSIGPLPLPWRNYGDSLYYYADCRKNATDISKGSYYTLHSRGRRNVPVRYAEGFLKSAVAMMRNERKRRSIIYNDPAICGSTRVFEAISGNLTYPKSGNYTAMTTCVWHIKVPVKYAVAITFDTFELEFDRNCFFDSVEFFDGSGTHARSLGKFCGTTKPVGIKSSMNMLTIKMTTDDSVEKEGFILRWNLTAPTPPHPGFLVTSNIVIDQIGPPPKTLQGFSFVFTNPKTCGLASNDVYCYFQYQTTIISRIIATSTLPEMKMHDKKVEVVFEHVIDLKSFPTLYNAKLFCMRWNTTIPLTDGGAWSRYGGKVYKTGLFKTICHYEKPGIFSLIAEAPFTEQPEKFRFTGSFYSGILFSIIWIVVLLAQWAFSRRINVPEWLNFNQTVALLLFLGTVLSGLTLDYERDMCSLLAFLLYYFGLGVFFWQFLKAAQVSGKFDDFFAKGRNEYIFYFILGWAIPIFIAGMAAGAMFYQRSEPESCWLALVGGSIWGYTSPTYFLVLGNLYMLYRASRKTKKNKQRFNHPALRKRLFRDAMQVLLFILTWVFGILCMLHKKDFAMQYCFCISLTLTVVLISLGAKQRRPGYQKIYYPDLIDKTELPVTNLEEIARDVELEEDRRKRKMGKYLSMRAFRKWRRFRKFELKLSKSALSTKGLVNAGYERHMAEGMESRSTVRSATPLKSPSSMRSTPSSSDGEEEASSSQRSSSDGATEQRATTREQSRVSTQREQSRASTSGVTRTSTENGIDGPFTESDARRSSTQNTVHRPFTQSRVSFAADIHRDCLETSQEMTNDDQQGMQDVMTEDEYVNNSQIRQSHESLRNSTGTLRETQRESKTPVEDTNSSIADEHKDQPNAEALHDDQENIYERQRSTPSVKQTSPEQSSEMRADNDPSTKEEETNPIPVFTINAFGGTPDNEEVGLQSVAPSSRLPSRAVSDRPPEKDVMSVCSLGEDDDPENAEDDENDAAPENLYDISMY